MSELEWTVEIGVVGFHGTDSGYHYRVTPGRTPTGTKRWYVYVARPAGDRALHAGGNTRRLYWGRLDAERQTIAEAQALAQSFHDARIDRLIQKETDGPDSST